MLLTSWLIYLGVLLYLKDYNKRDVYYLISVLSISIYQILPHFNLNYNPYPLYFAGILLANLETKDKLLRASFFILLFLILLLSIFTIHDPVVQKVLNALSIAPLIYLAMRQSFTLPKIYVFTYFASLIVVNFINQEIFQLVNIAVPVYLILKSIQIGIEKREKELESFKIKLKKSIEAEVEKEIEKLDIKLKLAQRKLKEIFKLNSYTIKEITIDEMADRVVKGLSDLGYTGSVLEISSYSIVKKEGFFPNLKRYLEDIFPNIRTVTELEDRKLLIIPLLVEDERLGTLSVYSKNEMNKDEIDYLITYATSIGTSIAKTNYLMQIIKLRDLIYTAIDSINIPLLITDTNFRVEIANRAFLKLVTKDSLNQESIFELAPELMEIKEKIDLSLSQKIPLEDVLTITKNGREYIYDIRVYPVISEQKFESVVFIIEDITEKREMEKQILHSEKLAIIGRLTASISHEIKNPLAIISQSAFSLKRKIAKSCNREYQNNLIEILERIERSTDRAKDIIDRLLNFSKPYYSRIERVNLKEVLQEAINLSILQTNKSNIKIHSYLKDVYVKGDKSSLIQLFINIIINSIEAIASTGKVVVKISEDRKNNTAKVSIKDTGCGIPPEILDKIFEPFFTTKDKGTGLGLAVSYRIVKDHGGDIVVTSKEGKGSEFIVKIPLLEEEKDG